jgi:hypothetical protein
VQEKSRPTAQFIEMKQVVRSFFLARPGSWAKRLPAHKPTQKTRFVGKADNNSLGQFSGNFFVQNLADGKRRDKRKSGR